MTLGDNDFTLVDSESAHHTVLLFSHDTIINATLSDYSSGEAIYRYKTNDNDTKTDFYLGGTIDKNALIGTLKSGVFGRTLERRGEKIKLSKWLIADGTFFTSFTDFPMTFCSGGHELQWRLDSLGRLALYDNAHPSDVPPVAWGVRSKKRIVEGEEVTYRAYLVLTDAVSTPGPIRDDVLFSWRVASATMRANDWRYERQKQMSTNTFLGGGGTTSM